ncbi:hypothetical protein [Sulfurisphaera tokodaii]|uniref:Uncharacterized protein n=2 Tax=Sulfurisphaera tokodaii TaxID=111955 RepID=F9VNR7_SULTO|nr:hypothetical protein [Sulfurisphaera tokodaii]BAK54425.1 hypothetical protein STK_09548 [Sulfurisphaera tokodaii str. 7]HII73932.1 hypothetical protein [Sulfurisphaera tokodaii]
MIDLMHADWDEIEELIEDTLNERIRTFKYFDYFIINPKNVLVKIYDDNDKLMFAVKMEFDGKKLEVIEVS